MLEMGLLPLPESAAVIIATGDGQWESERE
jgi:hypothetical protein